MIVRLVNQAAALGAFFFGWQAYCFAADGDAEFGAICISLALLLTGVGCVAGSFIGADLTAGKIGRLQRELRDTVEDREWWKAKALAQVDEVAWSRVEVRDLKRQLEPRERSA